jgi:hypothetical protein
MNPSTVPAKRNHTQVDGLDVSFGDAEEPRRTRKATTLPFITSLPSSAPVLNTNERRRVNPEALASRLGPEVVSALDALVPAGSMEMPSFQARKSVQERYNIDRRHVYDYYHAKGLRVERGVGASASRTPTRLGVMMTERDMFCSRDDVRALFCPSLRSSCSIYSPMFCRCGSINTMLPCIHVACLRRLNRVCASITRFLPRSLVQSSSMSRHLARSSSHSERPSLSLMSPLTRIKREPL